MSLLIEWAIYAALAAAAVFAAHTAWDDAKEHIAAPYVAKQVAADQKVVDAANADVADAKSRASHSADDLGKCQIANGELGKGVAVWQGAAQDADARADAAVKGGAAAHQTAQQQIAFYQAYAAKAANKNETCQVTLANTDKLLRDAAIAKQKAAK